MKKYSKKVTITPSRAREILDKYSDDLPRRLAWGTINAYATMMRNNKWVQEHPCGIIFDTNGKLIDGFHRLHALILANVPILFTVHYNWNRDDILETVDKGRTRSICDSLDMIYGDKMKYRHNIPSIATRIVALAMGDEKKNTVYSTTIVYKLYKKEIDEVMSSSTLQKRLSLASVFSALVIGAKVNLEKTLDFERKYFSGEGIYREEPAYRMRDFMLTDDRMVLREKRRLAFRLCLTALKNHFNGKTMRTFKVPDDIYEWFINNQEKEINYIRQHLQLN